ncbi:ODFP1 protein, partial [Smithornis capensis]|nr:ODFP1 protein [Smithornis capensis]
STPRPSKMLTSSCNRGRLALVDVEGFEPDDVSVTVKDGKVTVSAEREEGCSMADTYNYKKLEKEFNLPPGVSEDDVTYSM